MDEEKVTYWMMSVKMEGGGLRIEDGGWRMEVEEMGSQVVM
jgi:hypothetical protein